MAEFLVAARDLDSGYKAGDPVVVKASGSVWGQMEVWSLDRALGDPIAVPPVPGDPPPADWQHWLILVSEIALFQSKPAITDLWEPSQTGDIEHDSVDLVDRRVYRHKRRTRVFFGDLPPAKLVELQTLGQSTMTRNEFKFSYRHLTFNRTSDQLQPGPLVYD